MRVGMGYDIHRLVVDRPCILGGVTIAAEKGLLGHSDADVLLHAVADALLGAAALGDIGWHFPNTDPTCKDISSLKILERVTHLLREKKYRIVNVDATLVGEKPKIKEHIPKMKENIAAVLGVSVEDVGIKATTNEGLGHLGRSEGIAAYAVALIDR